MKIRLANFGDAAQLKELYGAFCAEMAALQPLYFKKDSPDEALLLSVIEQEESDILVLPSHVFGPLMAENIYVECFVYRTATELFSDVIGAVERLLFMTLEQRVASFLLDEAARRGTDTLAITQEAIALGIASAREAVTRALRQLAARGMVEVFRGGVKLLDRKALYALC